MDQELFFLNMMNKTRILRPPRHTLATFGSTELQYVLLSAVSGETESCHLREGRVTAQRPQIITPDLSRKRFEGFGEDTELYKGELEKLFGDSLRGLEYRFKNELMKTSLERAPLAQVAERAMSSMAHSDAPRTALIQGPDATWGLSVMKFIVDMSLRSFPVNLRELNEHNAFDPEKRIEARTRHHIERLFKEAGMDASKIKTLGEALKELGLFADYEDRFFALVKSAG